MPQNKTQEQVGRPAFPGKPESRSADRRSRTNPRWRGEPAATGACYEHGSMGGGVLEESEAEGTEQARQDARVEILRAEGALRMTGYSSGALRMTSCFLFLLAKAGWN